MSTNDFTTAARAEGLRLWPGTDFGHRHSRFAFLDGAVWARVHLAAQEPTDAEVLAVARLFYRTQCGHDLLDGSVYKDRWMNTALAALAAAKEARG